MRTIKQEEIEIRIANAVKPILISNTSFPLNNLDDRVFEILNYSIFKKRIELNENNFKGRYDNALLMQGVGDRGMDCCLMRNDKILSIIQCKKYNKNLSDKLIINELVKFSLWVLLNSDNFVINKDFTYYLSTSTGYTGKANFLPSILRSSKFSSLYDLEKITKSTINRYKAFNEFNFDEIKKALIKIIKTINYEFIKPEDLALWINDYPVIIETFFSIRKVTDTSIIERESKEIIKTVKELFKRREGDSTLEFLNNYKRVTKEKLNNINFIGFDIQKHRQKPNNITLTDVYVQPSFKQRNIDKNEKIISVVDRQELKTANLFKSEKNLVILGDPGAGKSLLVKYIIIKLLENQSEDLGMRNYANHFPLRIELRKFNEVRENKSVIEYLSEVLSRDYESIISARQLEAIFEKTNTLIFFDGLDEIFNISHKNKIKEIIEIFSSRFPMAKCIVTSRFIGYHDIKFDKRKFDEFAILKFNRTQINELVNKFYSTQFTSAEKKRIAIEGCLGQLEKDVDEELKSNPLILTLILILASNNIIIPDSKLEIYESCTKTLVDSIDLKDKELKLDIPVKNKNFVFAHLAYWQYESITKSHIVSYPLAVKVIADLLLSRGECKEYSEAEIKAEKFLEYAEKRSIYFENNFTHKTFLEYFTSDYLYTTCIAKASDSGRKRLKDIIVKYLPSPFWYIVFELLFSRIDRIQPDNELLDDLLSKPLESNSIDVFNFLVSNLNKFVNISRDVKKQIIQRTLILLIKGEKLKEQLKKGFIFEDNSLPFKINMLRISDELANVLQEVIFEIEKDGITEKQKIELYNLYYEIITSQSGPNIKGELKIKDINKLKELALKDLLLFSNVFLSNKDLDKDIDIQIIIDQIHNFGIKSLFEFIPLRHSDFLRKIDTFDLYLLNIIETSNYDKFKTDLQKLNESGLRFDMIIQHVANSRVMYFIRSKSLEKVLKLYLKSKDKKVDEILINTIKKSVEMKLAYQKFKSENPSSKLRKIDKIFAT